MSKKRRDRVKEQKQQQQKKRNLLYGGGFIVGLAIIAVLYVINQSGGIGPIAFRDMHGMSYNAEGNLYVAAHDGLRVYDDGWTVPDVPVNDYMGYSGTEDGFFSSGHPGPQSSLPNPLGLVRSTDLGATVTTINFAGESDFHAMAASYRGDTVYVFNNRPNALIGTGLHYSVDGGETWDSGAATGLAGNPIALAVHPDDTNIVAVTTNNGVFVSTDFGGTFQPISDNLATAITFDTISGDMLYFGYQELSVYAMVDGSSASWDIPQLSSDEAIMYIAVNPANEALAIGTSERDIYISDNDGDTWQQIVTSGSSS